MTEQAVNTDAHTPGDKKKKTELLESKGGKREEALFYIKSELEGEECQKVIESEPVCVCVLESEENAWRRPNLHS